MYSAASFSQRKFVAVFQKVDNANPFIFQNYFLFVAYSAYPDRLAMNHKTELGEAARSVCTYLPSPHQQL
jgi:hypothetical protein